MKTKCFSKCPMCGYEAPRKQAGTRASKTHSRYRGVSVDSANGGFSARIWVGGKSKYLGYFTTEEDAGKAYDIAAREAFGETAVLNFPQRHDGGKRSKRARS